MITVAHEATVVALRPEEMEPWPGLNPRRRHDPDTHAELVASIRENGVLEPMLVHDRASEPGDAWGDKPRPPWTGRRYWVIAGERRWRAANEVGVPVLCVVRTLTEQQALQLALIENLQRADMTAVEEARAFKRLLDSGFKQAELASKVGIDRSTIANRVRLLQLPDALLDLIEDGKLELAHARDLLLPFAQVPATKRTKLYGAVAKALKAEKRQLGESELLSLVAREAGKLSHAISDREMLHGIDDEPEFDAGKHRECKCHGPKFRYHGGSWGTKYIRCFDDAWWDAAQKAAIAKRKAAEKKVAQKLAAKGAAGDVAVMSDDAFRKRHGYRAALGTSRELVDASVLHDAPIAVVKSRWGGPEVHCLDDAALKKAKSAVTKERNRLIAERKAERAEKDRAEASKLAIQPWMLAEILTARPQNDTMLDVGRELGLNVGKHDQLHVHIKKMSGEDVELLFKVLALRSKRYDRSATMSLWRDPITEDVDKHLRKKYTPGVTALKKRAFEAAGIDPKAAAEEEASEPNDDDEIDAYVETQCIGCGCTDSHACEAGCGWLVADDVEPVGVCTECAESEEEAERMLAEHLDAAALEVLVEA